MELAARSLSASNSSSVYFCVRLAGFLLSNVHAPAGYIALILSGHQLFSQLQSPMRGRTTDDGDVAARRTQCLLFPFFDLVPRATVYLSFHLENPRMEKKSL
jgi:hypothetical protein